MEKSRKPDDTNFKQQRLRAWQPILTPWWVIGTFFVVGIIFLPVGVTLKNESDAVVEQIIQYDGAGTIIEGCQGLTKDNAAGKTCTIPFTTEKEMKMPVYVYYSLHNFYQNHRRYVKSRSDKQLRGNPEPESELTNCDPLIKATSGALLNPCGLIANSLFTDVITLNGAGTSPDYTLNTSDIAWKSDIENKFKNPVTDSNDMQTKCIAACTMEKCEAELANPTAAYDYTCGGECNWESAADTSSDSTQDGKTQYLWQTYPDIVPRIPNDPKFECKNGDLFGVTNEHFIVWMRTAGLPNFRKLYGRIQTTAGDSSTGTIPAGTTLSFNVDANFVVESFKGKKFLVISTTSWFGGKNSFLGIAYIVVGALCLVLSGLFLTKHKMSPRKLGDTRYLVWKDRN